MTLVSALGTVDHAFYDTHSNATKTIIDITTGSITLDEDIGHIKAGKTSYTDMQTSGVWLGKATSGGAINTGEVNEHLYFRGDTAEYLKFDTTNGLQVKSPSMDINGSNLRMGDAIKYLKFNGTSLEIAGEFSATTFIVGERKVRSPSNNTTGAPQCC